MSSTRNQIIATACELLENQGFHAMGLNQLVRESGSPKGSLYYYFPQGKEEIAEAAIGQAGHTVAERIRDALSVSVDAAEAVRLFVDHIAQLVEASGFRSGGPLMTIAMETATTNERLNRACRNAYTLLQAGFESKLVDSGYPSERAVELAAFITAAIEGGTMLCRVYHTGDPLRLVAQQLAQMLRTSKIS
jgi:TetR/AcrR family transcriptional repressor of lmrAB and yxaGH operons